MKTEYRPSEVAKFFNVSRMAVNKWIRAGKLSVHSTVGGHYRVPRENLVELIKNTGKPLPRELETDKYRILIVDDEKIIHILVKRILKGMDAEFASAYNCLEAGWKIAEFQPHLVILDAKMPGKNGDEVLKFIRGKESLKGTKVLVFTAYPDEAKKMLKLGADKAIIKGSDESEPKAFRKEVERLVACPPKLYVSFRSS